MNNPPAIVFLLSLIGIGVSATMIGGWPWGVGVASLLLYVTVVVKL